MQVRLVIVRILFLVLCMESWTKYIIHWTQRFPKSTIFCEIFEKMGMGLILKFGVILWTW